MKKRGEAFDYILLETTGLADPGMYASSAKFAHKLHKIIGPITSIFWQNEEFNQGLGNEIYLDGVVCVVDAVFGMQVCTFPFQTRPPFTRPGSNSLKASIRRRL